MFSVLSLEEAIVIRYTEQKIGGINAHTHTQKRLVETGKLASPHPFSSSLPQQQIPFVFQSLFVFFFFIPYQGPYLGPYLGSYSLQWR